MSRPSLEGPAPVCVFVIALGLALGPAAVEAAPIAEPPRYDHDRHAGRFDVQANCQTCHRLGSDGRLVWPGADDHAPCAGCHGDFRQRPGSAPPPGAPAPVVQPIARFCETCHTHSEPWRANPIRESFARPSGFAAGFPHGRDEHQIIDCARCHPTEAGRTPLTGGDPRAPTHQLCRDCHDTIARPRMGDCGGCHVAGTPSSAAAEASGRGGDWRVAGFEHALHGRDIRTAQRRVGSSASATGWAAFDRATASGVSCATCHGDPAQLAAPTSPMPRPSMSDCDGCHDGGHAFATTGFDCAKCHKSTEQTDGR